MHRISAFGFRKAAQFYSLQNIHLTNEENDRRHMINGASSLNQALQIEYQRRETDLRVRNLENEIRNCELRQKELHSKNSEISKDHLELRTLRLGHSQSEYCAAAQAYYVHQIVTANA